MQDIQSAEKLAGHLLQRVLLCAPEQEGVFLSLQKIESDQVVEHVFADIDKLDEDVRTESERPDN
jgi:hypothetical protein